MADILSSADRSERMSRIRGQNTRPELAIRRELHRAGLRYRLHVTNLPGSPDIVFPRYRAVVFVHGCFWHRHAKCSAATIPKGNANFWRDKFEANKRRDRRVQRLLRQQGWRVFVVWQCRLSSKVKAERTATNLVTRLHRMERR
jgi:DNA mismatch endonuclease (patch repair protein)